MKPPQSLAAHAVGPGDPAYPLLRSTYTRHHSPALVLRPESPAQVRDALAFARETGLPLAVRSGGHSLAGLSSNDGGIVVDLSRMHEITVLDRKRRLVRVAAGARWSRVARTLAPHGLSISSGDHGNVGVGGLATAGGIGWLVRASGLTIDRLRSADVVLADGTIATVSEKSQPDLFWGLRGAGANLAVVTAFVLEATEIPTVTIAQLEVELRRHSLVAWDEYQRSAPRELTSTVMVFGGRGMVTAVYAGDDPAAAERAFKPLGDIGRLLGGGTQRAPYRALVPVAHEHPNVGQQHSFVRNGYVDVLDRNVEREVFALAELPGALVQLRSLGGAVGDVAPEATAYANRHQSAMVIGTVFSRRELAELDQQWTSLRPHVTGAYISFDSDRGRDVSELAYPVATRHRLAELKRRVDPGGLFPPVIG